MKTITLTKEQIEILDHTVHRAAGGFYCGGGKDMDELVASGLMQFAGRKSFVPDDYFSITRAGREALGELKPSPNPAPKGRPSWTPLGENIYSYTRAKAIADGVQIEVTKTAQEAGIRFPVFLTRKVFDAYVAVPQDVAGQDEAGRLWDVVWMLRFAVRKAQPEQTRLPFALYVRNNNRSPQLVTLIAICGALDIDDPQPAITVMMPDEN